MMADIDIYETANLFKYHTCCRKGWELDW